MTYRTDYSFGVCMRAGAWVLVCDPGEAAPHCSECPKAAHAAEEWVACNRAKFWGGS